MYFIARLQVQRLDVPKKLVGMTLAITTSHYKMRGIGPRFLSCGYKKRCPRQTEAAFHKNGTIDGLLDRVF